MHKLVPLLFLVMTGCDPSDPSDCIDCIDNPCDGDMRCTRRCGSATLKARTTFDDYESATFSFRHATVKEDGNVLNNWDLLFGNDRQPDQDYFTVNMVTDDRSFIVDLGDSLTICDVPSQVDFNDYPVGAFGDHDDLPVELGHLYFIRNVDTDTRQVALIQTTNHDPNQSVEIRWYLSPDPDLFIPPSACVGR